MYVIPNFRICHGHELFPFSSYMQKTTHVFGSCATVLPKNPPLLSFLCDNGNKYGFPPILYMYMYLSEFELGNILKLLRISYFIRQAIKETPQVYNRKNIQFVNVNVHI